MSINNGMELATYVNRPIQSLITFFHLSYRKSLYNGISLFKLVVGVTTLMHTIGTKELEKVGKTERETQESRGVGDV